MESIVARIRAEQETPCFILAPRCCGQRQLIKELRESEQSIATENSSTAVHTGSTENAVNRGSVESGESVESAQAPLLYYEVCKETGRLLLQQEQGSVPLTHENAIQSPAHRTSQRPLALIASVPWLDDEESQVFSDELDALSEAGKRVVVCCSQQNDRYKNLQSDRIEVTARELKEQGYFIPEDYATSLKSFVKEFLPLQIRLAAVLTAVLHKVSREELSQLGFVLAPDVPELLAMLHPLFETRSNGSILVAEYISPEQLNVELAELIAEHLEQTGTPVSPAAITARITMLSMTLLSKDELESSHTLLGMAEDLLRNSKQAPMAQESLHDVPVAPKVLAYTSPRQELSLHMGLFGELRVSLDGKQIFNQNLSRTKVRRLLAFLALNQQRVVSRDMLTDYLWPHLEIERAQKNLYTNWCMLSKGLGYDSSRECPFLQRKGELYQINAETVTCDTQYFEDKAREVLLGQEDLDVQVKLLIEMEELYRDSLVADMTPDAFLLSRAASYRSLMVDSFLMVIRQLRRAGKIEKALFYARAAYGLDSTREDVYRELMDTQNMAGQRTSAMQTYFTCKQYLSDELGILPSRSTTALYQDLLLDSCG